MLLRGCASPRSSYPTPHAIYSWYEEDVWTEVAKLLEGRSLVMLAVTCKWFRRIMMEDSVWKYACLRDLHVPDPGNVAFQWIELHTTAFDGSHTYMFRQQEKHIGAMQTLDGRHIELFLSEEYRSGSWDYHILGSHNVNKYGDEAFGAIFDVKYLNDESTSDIFDLKSWVGKRNDWQPKAVITLHTIAVNANLQDNEGLQIKYHAMRAGKDGKGLLIRISQQLL